VFKSTSIQTADLLSAPIQIHHSRDDLVPQGQLTLGTRRLVLDYDVR
jgi:hypothetical protein